MIFHLLTKDQNQNLNINQVTEQALGSIHEYLHVKTKPKAPNTFLIDVLLEDELGRWFSLV